MSLEMRSKSQQGACMVSITIRDVPDDTRSKLAACAARGRRSMQEFLRLHLIELARNVDPGESWHE